MSEWQPIETAPKDGTWILAVIPGFLQSVSQWNTTYGKWMTELEEDWPSYIWEDEIASAEYHPTHWMPLPPPPESAP